MTELSSTSDSHFIDLIQAPTDGQKHQLFGNPGFGGSRGTIEDIFTLLFSQKNTLEQDKEIQETVSNLLGTLSGRKRYEFKKIIIDLIKSNLSYTDELKRELHKTNNILERNILLGKIKMMEEDLDMLEIPTQETKKTNLRKNMPTILLDRTICWPRKNEVLSFVKKVVLKKEFKGGESESLFSGINQSTHRFREDGE